MSPGFDWHLLVLVVTGVGTQSKRVTCRFAAVFTSKKASTFFNIILMSYLSISIGLNGFKAFEVNLMKWIIIGTSYDVSSVRYQVITWTFAELMLNKMPWYLMR